MMKHYDFDTKFSSDAAMKAALVWPNFYSVALSFRARTQSEGFESGYGSLPSTALSTPNKNSQNSDADDSFDLSSPFKPLDRELTPVETITIHRIAQKIAAHRINFGYVDASEREDFAYGSVANALNGVVGQSSKGLRSSAVVVPPKRKRIRKIPQDFCPFCKNNEEVRSKEIGREPNQSVWTDHLLKDETGKCICPVLRAHTCTFCGHTGDNAHTIRYCEAKKQKDLKLLS